MSNHVPKFTNPSDDCVVAPVRRIRSSRSNHMIDLFTPRGRWGHRPPLSELIDASGDCWQWTGNINRSTGYGNVTAGGISGPAHRVVWTILVGPIEDGLELDHLCRNRACVNPDHLEPVTRKENLRRGFNANTHKTHCPQGHPYAGDNLYIGTRGGRYCRECSRVHQRLYFAQRKAARA